MAKIEIELVDKMGSDVETPAHAARVSFNKNASDYTKEQNTKLTKYCAFHNHWTTLAHIQLTIQGKMSLAHYAQYEKHKLGAVNNAASRRYVRDQLEFFVPEWRSAPSKSIKQGSGGAIMEGREYINDVYNEATAFAVCKYNTLLDAGVAPEDARLVLPTGTMCRFVTTGSLVFFARVYLQRTHEGSQKSFWVPFCEQLDDICYSIWPISWSSLTRG